MVARELLAVGQPKSDVSDFGQNNTWPNSRKREFGCASVNPGCSSVLGTNPAAVVPAKAGTHNHRFRPSLADIALLRRMGPRLRWDDSGESSLRHLVAD